MMTIERNGCGPTAITLATVLAAALMTAAQNDAATAGEPARSRSSISGFSPISQQLPEAPPKSPEKISSFIDSISTTDAQFEVVVGQGRLITLKQELAVEGMQTPVIAVGDPSLADFEIVSARQVRVVGRRIGSTDLAITDASGETYTLMVSIVADLDVLRAQLAAVFPDAALRLGQVSDHIVVEGEARDTQQAARIVELIEAYLQSIQTRQMRRVSGQSTARSGDADQPVDVEPMNDELQISGTIATPRVINLIRIPGSQQVMLKVQVAELNRTGLRRVGARLFFSDGSTAIGTNPGSGFDAGSIGGFPFPLVGQQTNLAGVITSGSGNFRYWVDALRRNSLLKILAEPTVVAYHGEEASFLAGGEFPVPVPQNLSGGAASTVTVEWREFGVRLGFVPYVLDNERIRLRVNPEVSTIDEALGTVLVPGGTPVPGLNTRKSSTTVEMRQGQTLAMAGLLQVTLEGETRRLPGVGDVPVMGAFFSNNSNERTEKELIVLVTPYLVEAMDACEVGPLPGSEINEPNDLEFYLLGRLESRVGRDFRSTVKADDPLGCVRKLKLEKRYACGPYGFSQP